MRAGLPVEAHGVAVATLSVRDEEKHLLAAIEAPEMSEGVPVAPVEAVIYRKLVSPRAKDRLDLIELVRAGVDIEGVRAYLNRHAPSLAEKFEGIVRIAGEEDSL